MDFFADTPRGQSEEATSQEVAELKNECTQNRLSYIKNALALDKIGSLDDDDSDCDTNDGGTPFTSKKKADVENKFQAFQAKESEI